MNYKIFSSTQTEFLLLRLIEQYKAHDKLVIAYDIDDTVRPYHCQSCDAIQNLIREAKQVLDPYFIVFTSNSDTEGIKKFLNENNLPYDAINENAPFTECRGGKIYFNVLLDDKAGLAQASQTLQELIHMVSTGYITKEK